MKVKELIKTLLEYPMDVDINIYDRDLKRNRVLFYAGASPNDQEAWYDDNEMPHKASYVELLIGDDNEK